MQAYDCMPTDNTALLTWIERFPAQIVILCSQVVWCQTTELALDSSASAGGGGAGAGSALAASLASLEDRLRSLSESVLREMDPALRKKCEQVSEGLSASE